MSHNFIQDQKQGSTTRQRSATEPQSDIGGGSNSLSWTLEVSAEERARQLYFGNHTYDHPLQVAEEVTCCNHCNVQCDNVCGLQQVQADVLPTSETTPILTTTEQNITFSDSAMGQMGGVDTTIDRTFSNDQTRDMELERFLSRPVRIANFTWNESDAVNTQHVYNPWNLFFTDVRVRYKLNNFAFIQCKLKIKIMINASPFYYGSMGAFYQPLQNFTPSTIQSSAANQVLISYSQQPGIWLNPQSQEGGTITCPFFYHKNWINAQSASDMTDMGVLRLINYTTLQSANGATGNGVSVTIYAWAEDLKLSGPSVGLAVQSDEYGVGPVSRVASAVGSVANRLKSIPGLSGYATATQIGASAVSSVAKLFGFTNVPVIEDTSPYRSEPFPKMASTEIGYPFEKLTLDSKNELAVSGAAVGLGDDDELTIPHLVQHESYLTQTSWTTAQPIDTILFTSLVSPAMFDYDLTGGAPKYYQTPMCWLSNLFNNWRGDMIFRFKIVASPFHKGRVRISFDPAGYASENLISDAVSSNVIFTEIIDLADTNEAEIRIPYQQALPFLYNTDISNSGPLWTTSTTPTFGYFPTFHNGTITVRVHNILTAPISSSTVQVLVFVRGADNLEFANPISLNRNWSTFAVQSDTIAAANAANDPLKSIVGTGIATPIEEQYLINFGESVTSLRQLLRRQTLSHVETPANNITKDYWLWQLIFGKMPPMYGYDPSGIHSAKGIVVPGSNFNFNFAQVHPLSYVTPAFVGYRGSTHWTVNATGNRNMEHVRVVRVPNQNVSANAGAIPWTFSSVSASTNAQGFLGPNSGAGGQALTNQITQAGLNVTCPMYTPYRFQTTNPRAFTQGALGDGSIGDFFNLELQASGTDASTVKNLAVWMYCSAGTDFGLHFFLNVPTYTLLGPVTAN